MFRMKWIWTFLFVLSILAGLPSAASAQQTLTYGGSTTGTLSATAPVQVYTFSGEAGDFITVQGDDPDIRFAADTVSDSPQRPITTHGSPET